MAVIYHLVVLALFGFSTNKSDANKKQFTINYTSEMQDPEVWKKIDSLNNRGLVQSADALLSEYMKGVNPSQSPFEWVKTRAYKTKFMISLNAHFDVNQAFDYLQKEAASVSGPARQVMYSIQAELYFSYFNSNTYTIGQRTQVDRDRPEDINEWTAREFIAKTSELFLASISDTSAMSIPIDSCAALLTSGVHSERIVKNLYEFLLIRALEFYYDNRSSIIEPVQAFDSDNPELLSDYRIFSGIDLSSGDKSSYLLFALQTHQKHLITISANQDLKLYLELKRLKAIRQASRSEDRDSLYLNTLNIYAKEFESIPWYSEFIYEIASVMNASGDQYQALDSMTFQHRWLKKEAVGLLNTAIERFPDSYGAQLSRNLLNSITQAALSIEVENFVLPGKHFPMLIRFKQTEIAKGRIYRIYYDEWEAFNKLNMQDRAAFFASKSPVRNFEVKLPSQEDFQTHALEYRMDALDAGIYMVLFDSISGESDRTGISQFLLINVSAIDFISRQSDNSQEIWVTNRFTGCPQPGANIVLEEQSYEGRNKSTTKSYQTDKNGYAKVPIGKNSRNSLRIWHEESYILPYNAWSYTYDTKPESRVLFFTDRSIYRPGQTIYFKVLDFVLDKNRVPELKSKRKIDIQLRDPNNQVLSNITLQTNEYGSASGSFRLPESGLTGVYRMSEKDSWTNSYSFRMEEYKRPRFFVELEDPTTRFQLGERIKLAGNANMYAGVPVDGAVVSYQVVRTVEYPWIPWFRFPRTPEPEAIIAVGLTKVDESGRFELEFEAKPGKSPRSMNPVYIYQIQIDVTDQAGETRSASKSISVGTVPYVASVSIPGRIFKKDIQTIGFDIQNLAGITQSIDATVSVFEIESPAMRFAARKWERPDLYLYDKETYAKYFPQLAYSNEDQRENWKVKKEVLSAKVNPAIANSLSIRSELFKTGVYKAEIKFRDEKGAELSMVRFFEVYDADGKVVPQNNEGLWLELDKQSYEPGAKAIVHVGFAYGKACVYLTVEKHGKIVRQGWQEINGKYSFEIPVEQSDRGGFYVHAFHPLQEGMVSSSKMVVVPWSNKELDIEWLTKRDFTDPGSDEEWIIKISGKGKDSLAAEMLASMYDQSLDQLHPHSWQRVLFPQYSPKKSFQYNNYSHNTKGVLYKYPAREKGAFGLNRVIPGFRPYIRDMMNMFSFYMDHHPVYLSEMISVRSGAAKMEDGAPPVAGAPSESDHMESALESQADAGSKALETEDKLVVSPRENLNETVFFFPDLRTDESGNILLSFRMNEALTRWRLMLFAHDKRLATAYQEYMIETRKDLMVFPNVPRFVRQNDRIEMSMKVNNQTDQPISVKASLMLKDAISGTDLSHWLQVTDPVGSLEIDKGASLGWSRSVQIPDDFAGLLEITYSAISGKQSDAEVHLIPVLTNRMLVTESLPLWANERESRSFDFISFKEKIGDDKLKHQSFTLEFSPNPAWYALQSLPYMMEYPHKCTEQILSRFYAHSIGTKLINQYPQVKKFFEQWSSGEDVLSNLQKNQELKSVLLSETPWLLQAKSEEEQRRNLALFFNLNQMRYELDKSIRELVDRQSNSGGFSWFPGGRDNWYITQYVVEKLGHLDKLGIKDVREDARTRQLLLRALSYCDVQATDHYNRIKKLVDDGKAKWTDNHLNSLIVHYMYSRSFFMDFPKSEELRKIHEFYLDQMDKHFMNLAIYEQACASLSLHRNLRKASANEISRSLLERSLYKEELGRYWRLNRSWLWNEAPLETQAILIESVEEILNDRKKVDEMRRWLLKHKQTNSWPSTKSTAQAIYALLISGTQWMGEESKVAINISGQSLDLDKISKSAGSNYFKIPMDQHVLNPSNPVVQIKNDADHPAWGALYWQYFQDLDRIKTFSDTPLKLKKEVYRKIRTPEGAKLELVNTDNRLKVGDLITVRIILQVDRSMEFLHMKDMRASGLEPVSVISKYHWQGGLGYYQSIRDSAVDFFFDYIGPGTYVFEYELRVFHAGDFSNGVTTIQSMYAPEFTSHSKGIRLEIVN